MVDKKRLAEYLQCSIRHITNLQKSRIIPFYRIGRAIRFKICEVEAALKAYQLKSIGSF
jgi:excisionase family DNA binding protein